MKKTRLDITLVQRNLVPTRSQAQTLIRSGQVFLNDQKAITPSQLTTDKDKIIIKEKLKYVSRGGLKLEHALKEFKINPQRKICLDIGSSTGGFTDCLIQHHAQKVYALDVGTHQLADKLKNNPLIISLEQTHFLKINQLPDSDISLITIDVSFISSKKILLHIFNLFKPSVVTTLGLSPDSKLPKHLEIILLLKPQFESSPKYLKKGVVKDPKIHQQIINDFQTFCQENHITVLNTTTSPIRGPKGNIEFLFHLNINL